MKYAVVMDSGGTICLLSSLMMIGAGIRKLVGVDRNTQTAR
jgi:hypothetical protein